VILADTSIWVDHLRSGNAVLTSFLEAGLVVAHPWVIGELSLGNLRRRSDVLHLLRCLPGAVVASDAEIVELIDREGLYGVGIGYVDAQLLAAALLTPEARLWTGEKRLRSLSQRLGVGFQATRA
jgi:hypothetical protein